MYLCLSTFVQLFVQDFLCKNMCSVREIKAHEAVLQDNDQRAEGCMCGAGVPAVRRSTWKCVLRRKQHVEVRVEEKQKIHDVRKTRIHEFGQLRETRGKVNYAVKASSWQWSTRHGPQSCILR